MSAVLAYVGAAVIALWGVAHVLPTARVVHGYSDTSADNRLVIAQEWIAEALTMWFIAAIVLIATAAGGSHRTLTDWLDRVSALMLLARAPSFAGHQWLYGNPLGISFRQVESAR